MTNLGGVALTATYHLGLAAGAVIITVFSTVGGRYLTGQGSKAREAYWFLRAGSTVSLSMGIVALIELLRIGRHYPAMAALSYQSPGQLTLQSFTSINLWLVIAVGLAALLTELLVVLASLFRAPNRLKRAPTETLPQRQDRCRFLIDNACDLIAIIATDSTILYLNSSVERLLGYAPDLCLGKQGLKLVHPEDIAKAQALLAAAWDQPAADLRDQLRLRHRDGSWPVFEVTVNNCLQEPSLAGIVSTCRDITQYKQMETFLRESEERYRAIAALTSDFAYATRLSSDGQWTVEWVTEAFFQMTGYTTDDIREPGGWAQMIYPEDWSLIEHYHQVLMAGAAEDRKLRLLTKARDIRWVQVYAQPQWDQERQRVVRILGAAKDITEQQRTEEELRHSAFHDPLTGLPNRALFIEHLEHAIAYSKRHEDYRFAVLFLDLDRFKVLNDCLGHTLGDQFLITVAQRLQACLRSTDRVARLGGDEFTLLIEGIQGTRDAIQVAERIQAELAVPVQLGAQKVSTTVSIGIALSTTGYHKSHDCLRDADIAMYRAKTLGKARYQVFDPEMHILAVARLQLETDLYRAIESQEFCLQYQPIVSLATGKIIAFEALIRWHHPERGLLSPAEFIPAAEETGVISRICRWVIYTASKQLQSWQAQYTAPTPLKMHLNLSSQRFTQPNLIEEIAQILLETGLDGSSLRLEITEGMIMDSAESTLTVLLQLRELGVELTIDDFGTGYSSLGRLHHFPIHGLKVDRSFVSKMGIAKEDSDIVETIITLAHKLAMHVTAEGVETAEQLAQLRALGCDYGQGYFFSEPVDSEAAKALIAANC